jgi:2-amino-4-hydroxy-6-hydroxymethyldihydropteridine diphosphokinase
MILHTAYIGLGANLDQPERQLRTAIAALDSRDDITLTGISRLYGSAPIGPADQPDYLNAAVAISTRLTPHDLLAALQAIENAQGRVREQHWGPRTLDLDLLLFAHDVMQTRDLTLPHPEIANRAFVVLPLLDLAPALHLPDGRTLAALAPALAGQDIRPLADGNWWQAG